MSVGYIQEGNTEDAEAARLSALTFTNEKRIRRLWGPIDPDDIFSDTGRVVLMLEPGIDRPVYPDTDASRYRARAVDQAQQLGTSPIGYYRDYGGKIEVFKGPADNSETPFYLAIKRRPIGDHRPGLVLEASRDNPFDRARPPKLKRFAHHVSGLLTKL